VIVRVIVRVVVPVILIVPMLHENDPVMLTTRW